jgi:YetA-like protein
MKKIPLPRLATLTLTLTFALSASAAEVPVTWLDQSAPTLPSGVSFGVPWTRGAMKPDQAFVLTAADGKSLPVQTWPLAYWPDGSLKWSGFATVAGPEAAGPLKLATADAPAKSDATVKVTHSDTTYQIDTGRVQCRILKWGTNIIDSIIVDGREVARHGRLVCILQDGPEVEADNPPARELFGTKVDEVTVEQSGPVRAVVKIEGKHRGARTSREWLPFVVRLYFYAGQDSIRMVHTIIYDGDQKKDFIRGLGIVFSVPMREQVQNRHVRFSGENGGLWAEPIQPMKGRDGRFVGDPATDADVYPLQVEGRRVPNREQVSARSQGWLADWAVWDDYKLVQPNADGFTVVKRTNPESAWLPAGAGRRASGLVFAGDVSGGLGLSVKNFWQSYPASLEVRHAGTSEAEVYAWLWSPDAPAMDMRHYDTRAHGLEAVYEDVQDGMSLATGVARTSELMIFPTAGVPAKADTAKLAQASARPPVLVCTPQYLHAAQAFGLWGLEDRSTPVKKAIEDRLATTINYYLTQPEQRNWYGFWDFGDVMHSYDPVRHVWRYDLGGMAWDNTELGSIMWLWYSFLHTGRADIFRLAEAMDRNTSEVSVYHLGPFAGLGSRHDVRHWGDGAKEARISQAGYHRFYYYLTTDERTGDVLHEVRNVDYKTVEFDPMREALPITPREKAIAPTRVRLGPDWLAFLGNWMTEWERTRDTQWRDKILAGVESLNAMPLGLRTGKSLVFGYDPKTGKLYELNDEAGTYNLATIMGGAEVVFELNMMLDDPHWQKLWLQYCRLYSAPKEVILQDMKTGTEGNDAAYVRDGRLAAYLYTKTQNPAFAQAAIASLLTTGRSTRGGAPRRVEGPDSLNPVDESGSMGTNGAAQNGLETITMLGMVGDRLPAEFPPASEQPAAPRRRAGAQPQPAKDATAPAP